MTQASDSLSGLQQSRLLIHCRCADELLAEIESILSSSTSKSPFPQFRGDFSLAQSRVVQDYISRLRAQMVAALKVFSVEPGTPDIGAIHAIRTNLDFVHIAFEEMRAGYLRGYGAVPESQVAKLDGIVNELEGLVDKLDRYLGQGLGQDLRDRLSRLEGADHDVEFLGKLEHIVARHGLVEFRPALEIIIDRMETKVFEIALFGRVSSGKSSMLNHVLRSEVLPVGVNPVTSVPTRLRYGAIPGGTVWFADSKPRHFELEQLKEFVTEKHNPANMKHITRLVVDVPSMPRHDGMVFVDTPGLGALATLGAAETLAYLPQCDLGVVLIDAGSTIGQEDISTIRSLFEGGIPALVLLSKSDLLTEEDRASALQYVAGEIESNLGLKIHVEPVSVMKEHAALLDIWFRKEILPLYDHRRHLSEQSVERKIGALGESVMAALQARLRRGDKGPNGNGQVLKETETRLRDAAAQFQEMRQFCREVGDEVRSLGPEALEEAASGLLTRVRGRQPELSVSEESVVALALTRTIARRANLLYKSLKDLAGNLIEALSLAGAALEAPELPAREELASIVKEMPKPDLGTLQPEIRHPFLSFLGKSVAKQLLVHKLRAQMGSEISSILRSYGLLLESWAGGTLKDMQRHFDAHADAFRAQLQRLAENKEISAGEADLRQDLEALASWPRASTDLPHESRHQQFPIRGVP
jgi:GTP-binding protein EngB required for normal cell division